MKLQNLTVIFIIIILPIILLTSLYISTGTRTIELQALYDAGLANATHDAMHAFEQNTINNKYSDNPETKRSIIKASVKMFKTSLATSCNISAYDSKEIDEYIPALVFGMYDGFYMYAPTLNSTTGKYEKDIKSYVYYSETLDDETVIRYSLDNYVSVTVKKSDDTYEIKEGYLINLNDLVISGGTVTYKGVSIKSSEIINGNTNTDAIKYYNEAKKFTEWFLKIGAHSTDGADISPRPDYLKIGDTINGVVNDPENPNSAFVKHKQKIIRDKIATVLNSTITAYSNRTWGTNYKMPKLSEEDWEKIYNNISMISFFQGKSMGLTKYNGYCVLNSTNSTEFVNPSLMYFIDDSKWYHDIRCTECTAATNLTGYKVGSFEYRKETKEVLVEDPTTGDEYIETKVEYKYDFKDELACYNCINSSLANETTVYDYIAAATDTNIKTSYWTSLARERYGMAKLTNIIVDDSIYITFDVNEGEIVTGKKDEFLAYNKTYLLNEPIEIPAEGLIKRDGYTFAGWSLSGSEGDIISAGTPATHNAIYKAVWVKPKYALKLIDARDGTEIDIIERNIGETVTLYSRPDEPPYRFMGWSTDMINFIDAGTSITVTGNVSVYAHWYYTPPITYTVTFDTKGGSGISPLQVSPGATITKPPDPHKADNKFVGWYKDSSCTQEFDFTTVITGDMTLYAKWEPILYCTVSFDTKGGSSISSKTVIKGEKVEKPTDPTKSGVAFVGWYIDSAYTTKFDFNTPITSNITLYAKWSPMIEYVQYSSGKIYAKISSDIVDIDTVEIRRTIWGVTHTRDMDPSTKVISGKQYNYEYDFAFNPSEGKECTIIVTDTNGNKDTYIYTIP